MVDISKVEGMIRNLHRFIGYLEEIATLGSDDFLADPMKTGAAKYYLQVSIEACIGMASHIIASEGYRAPRNYKDAFAVLGENGVISQEFVDPMQAMAGFRNLLVHLYWKIDVFPTQEPASVSCKVEESVEDLTGTNDTYATSFGYLGLLTLLACAIILKKRKKENKSI